VNTGAASQAVGSAPEPAGELGRLLSGPASTIAPRLLGLVLTVGERSGRIVEVEAYEGPDDPASHAFRGPTARTEVMFGPPGHLYVYLSYGVHWCANIVCHPDGVAGAVLLRALEPLTGVDGMWSDRPAAKRETDLASGPGKLCAALGITDRNNGVDLLDNTAPVRLQRPADHRSVSGSGFAVGPRIGITKAVDRPWRFGIADSPHLSRRFP